MHLNQTYPITDILNLPIEIDRFIIDANIHKNQRANIIINHSNHLVMLDALFGYLTQQEQQCNLYKRYSTYTTPVDNIMTRPMWSKALGEYHCAIPVTGFYKWKQEHPQATPYYYQPKDNQIAYLAGFYNFNETNSNYSFSVLTCASQMQSQKEEHGMPLVMNYEQAMAWLDNDTSNIFAPFPATSFQSQQVCRIVARRNMKDFQRISRVYKKKRRKKT